MAGFHVLPISTAIGTYSIENITFFHKRIQTPYPANIHS